MNSGFDILGTIVAVFFAVVCANALRTGRIYVKGTMERRATAPVLFWMAFSLYGFFAFASSFMVIAEVTAR